MSDYDDLVDRNEIAHLLGVGPTAVSNYVARTSDKHDPFPEAVITRSNGRFRLWSIYDIIDWFDEAFPKRDDSWVDDYERRLCAFRGES